MKRIILENAAKRYTGAYIFRDVNLDFAGPGVLCLCGPNGSGKTTLMRVMCGLLRPTRGRALVDGGGKRQPPAQLRRTFGIQSPGIVMYPELTVRENIEFVLTLRGASWGASRADELLERLNLAYAEEKPAAALSSGMRQKLALILALAHDPDTVFLDEPTSFLDADGRARVAGVIKEIRSRALIVIATNDAEERSWGDSIFELGR
jgi:ABC-type multidrug transport system ATPase subunit